MPPDICMCVEPTSCAGGILYCDTCGGDFCICICGGDLGECPGCPDCAVIEDREYDDGPPEGEDY